MERGPESNRSLCGRSSCRGTTRPHHNALPAELRALKLISAPPLSAFIAWNSAQKSSIRMRTPPRKRGFRHRDVTTAKCGWRCRRWVFRGSVRRARDAEITVPKCVSDFRKALKRHFVHHVVFFHRRCQALWTTLEALPVCDPKHRHDDK